MRARILLLSIAVFVFSTMPLVLGAQTAEELRKQIDDNTLQIEQLNKEIAQYEAQLTAVAGQKQTLQNTLKQLDLSKKKLTASISATKKGIATTEIEISQLQKGIATKEHSIENNELGLAESLRSVNETESVPLAIRLLTSGDISEAWRDIDEIARLQEALRDDIKVLSEEKQSLTETKTAQEQKRSKLKKQQSTLVSQQGSLNATIKAQNELLVQTKAEESNYQKILREKQAAKASFENALLDLQSKLQYTVDPSKITPAGKGVLAWPLDKVRITQEFGNTDFARSGAYSGKGHNGMDLAAQIGTPVKAALSGVVKGAGDTGSVPGCYSYGRWVLIRHNNGLDTLYAHLSQIGVSAGDAVATGQVIGYSGQTGYATGPHLHFGVYASSATQIMKLKEATQKQTTPCANATMPIAPLSGYLNPESYL
ncbi:MAG TPA: peptidoglycan DD-metalloendopeptidase family protein [Candidatus Paceibacterota bacterium]